MMDLRVLIAEEQPDIEGCLGQNRAGTAYEFVYAAGFPEAVKLASEKDAGFGFLVTDILLKPFHGRDLANRLVGLFPHIKVLFMGKPPARLLRTTGLLPAKAPYLHKPFDALHLIHCLDELKEKGPSWLDLILFHSEETAGS